jgi:hypothetical protein
MSKILEGTCARTAEDREIIRAQDRQFYMYSAKYARHRKRGIKPKSWFPKSDRLLALEQAAKNAALAVKRAPKP